MGEGRRAAAMALPLARDGASSSPTSEPLLALEDGSEVVRDGAGIAVLDAERRVIVRYADGNAELVAPAGDLRLSAPHGRIVLEAAQEVMIATPRLVQRVARFELEAERVVQRARTMLLDVRELAEQRLGRLRTRVKDVYSLSARRSVLRSKDDTSIDGKRILLG